MNEDLFSQLFDLFNQPGPVNWKLAAELTGHLAGGREPIEPRIAEEYQHLSRLAQLQITGETPLDPGAFSDAIPTDRRGWADSHLMSFRYLVEPIAPKFAEGAMPGPLAMLGPALLGLQMGIMVGFVSQRTLGHFDLGLPSVEAMDISFIVPNIEAFATENGLDRRQVRLWVALREIMHTALFSKSWVRPHFLELVERYLDGLELDPEALAGRLQGFQDPEQFEQLVGESGGFSGLLTTPEQQPDLEALQAFVAIIDGYAEYLMNGAAARLLPDLARMREALNRRRSEPAQGEEVLTTLLGLEVRPNQEIGTASFCDEVARRWGEDALTTLWEQPANLPTLAELTDPVGWAARVLLPTEDL
ncbi:MAG: zinc-dependent metalloprotease [Actinobacteria bacterium]|nr:zinc-dependent metalloprotease [Actinomycetota bacterium]